MGTEAGPALRAQLRRTDVSHGHRGNRDSECPTPYARDARGSPLCVGQACRLAHGRPHGFPGGLRLARRVLPHGAPPSAGAPRLRLVRASGTCRHMRAGCGQQDGLCRGPARSRPVARRVGTLGDSGTAAASSLPGACPSSPLHAQERIGGERRVCLQMGEGAVAAPPPAARALAVPRLSAGPRRRLPRRPSRDAWEGLALLCAVWRVQVHSRSVSGAWTPHRGLVLRARWPLTG